MYDASYARCRTLQHETHTAAAVAPWPLESSHFEETLYAAHFVDIDWPFGLVLSLSVQRPDIDWSKVDQALANQALFTRRCFINTGCRARILKSRSMALRLSRLWHWASVDSFMRWVMAHVHGDLVSREKRDRARHEAAHRRRCAESRYHNHCWRTTPAVFYMHVVVKAIL